MLVLCGSVADAAAEVGDPIATVQTSAASAAWLAYTPPPATPSVVCLVDSGVDPNPDTEEVVVGSHALYPETNTGDEIARLAPRAQPGSHPDGHGTLMAMLMAAPVNGWGMVGMAPSAVRVYNMKALKAGSTSFSDEKEAEGIEACTRLRQGPFPALSVINLSLAGESSPEPATASEIDNAITAARNQGISVVAATGNTAGAVGFPASYPSVLAVGAEDANSPGTLCSFSSHGEGVDLLAPGCDTLTGGVEGAFQDTGEPDVSMGTSQASSLTSAVLASIRAYGPSLTMSQAEQCLTSTTHSMAIDVAAAFEACGLASVVQAGLAAEPKPSTAATGSTGTQGTTYNIDACQVTATCAPPDGTRQQDVGSFEACPTPRVLGVLHKDHRLTVLVRKVGGCSLQARVLARHNDRKWWLTVKRSSSSRLSLPTSTSPRQPIEIRFIGRAKTPSQWITVTPRCHASHHSKHSICG
ncbi:MAG: S8 family peptidase [Solirubrobacteraceae bacterium]